MRLSHWLILTTGCLLVLPLSCATNNMNNPMPQCSDGIDNDADGMIDFPADPGCTAADDDSEDSSAQPQCNDGRDNDNDGKIDYPADPGCFAAQQDDETDDCPAGPGCPQCSDGMDNDGNGQIDFPNDIGCTAASDNDEYTESPAACGSNVHIKQLPFDKHVAGMVMAGVSNIASPTCTGIGAEDVYELRLTVPKVVVADTSSTLNALDTVLSIRSAMCAADSSELICNDDVSSTNKGSKLTIALQAGTYYLIVDTKTTSPAGSYDLTVNYFAGEGTACQAPTDCGPGLVCRIPLGGTGMVCSKHVCEDGVDDDADGKLDYPTDPGCDTPQDDDEADTCPSGATCPQCSNGIDDDGDGHIDYPADLQCLSASGAAESYCTGETDLPEVAITAHDTPSTTVGKHNDFTPTCSLATNLAPDVTFSFALPVPVTTIQFDTNNSFDTVLSLRDAACTTVIACDDDNGTPGFESLITRTNMAAGNYSITVDGYGSNMVGGAFTLHVFGTVAAQTACSSPLFASGVLACPAGTTCTGTPKKCQ
ncbi:MAG: cell surface receptor domain protein [Myxococcales bacterium]|nr:cell surface receptor domain protein [Myxococcales bacterium]